jgi:hypothetical protein
MVRPVELVLSPEPLPELQELLLFFWVWFPLVRYGLLANCG